MSESTEEFYTFIDSLKLNNGSNQEEKKQDFRTKVSNWIKYKMNDRHVYNINSFMLSGKNIRDEFISVLKNENNISDEYNIEMVGEKFRKLRHHPNTVLNSFGYPVNLVIEISF